MAGAFDFRCEIARSRNAREILERPALSVNRVTEIAGIHGAEEARNICGSLGCNPTFYYHRFLGREKQLAAALAGQRVPRAGIEPAT